VALNVYDVLKHHIGLGIDAGDLKGLMLAGGYGKEMQREGLGGQDFGGSTDLIGQVPSLSRWTQDDFTGGGYQEDWTKDAAMFSRSTGLISETQSRALVSVPPLAFTHAFDVSAEPHAASPGLPVDVLRVNNLIFVAFLNGIFSYNITADTSSWWQVPSGLIGIGGIGIEYEVTGMEWEPNERVLYVLCSSSTTYSPNDTEPTIFRLKTDFSAASGNAGWACPTDSTNDKAYGFALSQGGIVLSISNMLYLGAVPKHPNTASGSVKWTKIGRLPGSWIDSCSYTGRTYILCGDTHGSTSLVAFDGTSVQPIATFPWNFDGTCITEYAGRLYIGGHGTNVSGDSDTAQLYEVTGASVRLVRSFGVPAARGADAVPTSITCLAVDEGLLWMNCKGHGLIAYDVTSDGLFGGSIYAPRGADFDVYALLGGYGRLWAWGHSDASFATQDGLYRIAHTGDTIADYSAELVTSDFASRSPSRSASPSSASSPATSPAPPRSAPTAARAGRPSPEPPTTSTASTTSPPSTSPPSPPSSTGASRSAWTWEPTPPPSASWSPTPATSPSSTPASAPGPSWSTAPRTSRAATATTVAQDVPLTATTLWGWAQGQTKLVFKDLDGSTANVQIQGFKENQPVIGPNVAGRPEAFYSLALIEV
jgi:hypothetical protein